MMKTDDFMFTLRWVPDAISRVFLVIVALMLAVPPPAAADIPDSIPSGLGGVYKLASSNDPMFPSKPAQEVFLDFGSGNQAGKLSGSVAISVRRNPNVKVVIMAWQYFPDYGKFVIGNRFGQGSRNAVAKAVWFLNKKGGDVILERGTYRVVLKPADPDDF